MASNWTWSPAQRSAISVLTIGLLGLILLRYALNPQFVSDPQPAVPDRAADLADRIDPNTADWQTLAALPMIGEKRARDIVAYRERYLARHPAGVAFAHPTDLMSIRGIGVSTLAQIRPFLVFPTTAPTTRP
ncbi:MAG: ComEA family DNA-binding protein [Tepidisphaeraceae bacterium]